MNPHLTLQQMNEGLPFILQSPPNHGEIELLVIRPAPLERKIVEEISINKTDGAAGDIWKVKQTSSTPDGNPHPEKQVTIMNSRCINLLAGDKEFWSLAGDQVYADLDLSEFNLPHGTDLKLGTAILRVSASPHNGCKKFSQRFGKDAMRFVNSPEGKSNHLRGINTYVIKEGVVRMGDKIEVLRNN